MNEHRRKWSFRKNCVYLNHGSFGACPIEIQEYQQKLREEMETQPMNFLIRSFEDRYLAAQKALADLVGSASEDLVFIQNATTAVNTVLRSLSFEPGDELLINTHTYDACKNAVEFVAERHGAKVVKANIPFPISGPEDAMNAVQSKVTDRTRFVLLDHICSPTGLVLPVEDLVIDLESRGIRTMVDGAHAVGMLALQLDNLGASYYTSNCHKWLCAPKGAAFLHVRRDRQKEIRPLSISHAASMPIDSSERFQAEFAWTGTGDPTPFFTVPKCIDFLSHLYEDGIGALMERNRSLTLKARTHLCESLNTAPPCPDSMVGAMFAMSLPDGDAYALREKILSEYGMEVVVSAWPKENARLLRLSLQAYNSYDEVMKLSSALKEVLAAEQSTQTI